MSVCHYLQIFCLEMLHSTLNCKIVIEMTALLISVFLFILIAYKINIQYVYLYVDRKWIPNKPFRNYIIVWIHILHVSTISWNRKRASL